MAVATRPTRSAAASTEKTAIPSAIRPKGSSAAEMLAKLAGTKVVEKKPSSTKARPGLALTPEATALYKRFIPAKVLFDHFETHKNNVSAELKTVLFDLWAKALWAQKSQPANPSLKVNNDEGKPDLEGVYIVQAKFKVQASSPENAKTTLLQLGLEAQDVENLVDNELDFTPQTSLRPFNELIKGHKEGDGYVEATASEQLIAEKLLQFVMGQEVEPLTDAERDIVLRNEPKIVVKDGFLQRVASYCHSSEQVAAVFQVVSPTHYPKGAKFGISDSLDAKNTRLLAEAAEILGTELGVSQDIDDED